MPGLHFKIFLVLKYLKRRKQLLGKVRENLEISKIP